MLCVFCRNKHIMIDLGTGNNNKINWTMEDKQEMIDIVETVYRGARKGRGLVVSPKDYSTKYRYWSPPPIFSYLKPTPIYGHHGFVFLNFVDKPNRTIFLLIHTCYFVPFAIIVSRLCFGFFFFLVKVFIKPDGIKKKHFYVF